MNATISASPPLLALVDETIAYPDCIALEHVTLAVERGEKIALIGPSGSGKSSLLRRLYQVRPAACAFIHQHYALVPQLSTFHNVYMGRLDTHSSLYNLLNLVRPRARHIREITALAERLGLSDKLWTRIGELSGGQQQRVGIGRALYRGGEILMADEPVSSLDAVQGREIMTLLTAVGTTVVAALHSVELAREFCDRIIGLNGRQIRFDLPAARLTDEILGDLYT